MELTEPGEWARSLTQGGDLGASAVEPLSVLLVAFAYPPYPASGSMRAEKVANALGRRGHFVRVLTAPAVKGERGIRVSEPGLSVRVLRYPRNPRHALLRLRDLIRGSRDKAHTNGAAPIVPPDATPRARTKLVDTLRSLLFVPDEEQGFAAAVISAGLGELRSGVDLLYTTAPPFSSHLAGLVLKRLSGLPWIAEFRDPWTNNPVVARLSPQTSLSSRLETRMERAVFHTADQIVVGTEALRDQMCETYGAGAENKIVLARNGIDTIAAQPSPPSKKPEFLHLGTLYGARSAESLLKGFAQVDEVEMQATEPRLRFVGGEGDAQLHRYGGLAESLGVMARTQFEPWKQRSEALALLSATDFLLLLAIDQPSQVPNKLYEYLGTRKPIVALVDEGGESAHLLRQSGNHILITEDTPEAWAQAFRQALDMARNGVGAVSSVERLEQWTTERQFANLVSTVES